MNHEFMSRYQFVPYQKDEIDSVYEKMACFYHAKCEIYDRSLTHLRSRFDRTEAFVVGEQRKYSTYHAELLRKKIFEWYREKFKMPFDIERWKKADNDLCRMSAQYPIDMYEYFLKNNDEIICELDGLI